MLASKTLTARRGQPWNQSALPLSYHVPNGRPCSQRVVASQAASKRAADAPSVPQLTRPKPATAAQKAQAQPPPPPASAAAVAEAFKRVADAKTRGEAVDVKVVGQTEAGLTVQYGPLRGLIPYTKVDPARLRTCTSGDLSTLIGQQLKAKIVSVDAARKELVLSERMVAAAAALGRLKPGEVVTAVVTGVEDYGAFVQVKGMPDVSGLIHKSEVSWDRIMTVDQVVSTGQEVRAKVLSVDVSNCRLALSLKQTSADPLRLSLDGLAWGGAPADGPDDPRVAALVAGIAGSPGVDDVTVTRAATDPHHVAPELSVYLVRSEGEDAGEYRAVARLGVGATELRLRAAELSREQVKQLLQRVAARAAAE